MNTSFLSITLANLSVLAVFILLIDPFSFSQIHSVFHFSIQTFRLRVKHMNVQKVQNVQNVNNKNTW